MEEVIEELKKEFKHKNYNSGNENDNLRYKTFFTIGYLEDNRKVTRKEAMQIMKKVLQKEI